MDPHNATRNARGGVMAVVVGTRRMGAVSSTSVVTSVGNAVGVYSDRMKRRCRLKRTGQGIRQRHQSHYCDEQYGNRATHPLEGPVHGCGVFRPAIPYTITLAGVTRHPSERTWPSFRLHRSRPTSVSQRCCSLSASGRKQTQCSRRMRVLLSVLQAAAPDAFASLVADRSPLRSLYRSVR